MQTNSLQGRYALVQYCPVPERMEYINVGLILSVPSLGYGRVEFVDDPSRVERLFGRQSHEYFRIVTEVTQARIDTVLRRDNLIHEFAEFSDRRANEIRVTTLLSVRVNGDPDTEFDRLFTKLVDVRRKRHEPTRARTRLRKAFLDFGVDHLLDKPVPVEISDYDIKITVPYAYQNGRYNLIDSIRLTKNHAESMREAGKKAFEGALIARNDKLFVQAKLIIVADFSEQSVGFYNAIRDHLHQCDVKLFRFDEIDVLVDDILRNAEHHA